MPAIAPASPCQPSEPSLELTIDLGDTRDRLLAHRLYDTVDTPDKLRRFMEFHVYAVWDFQSLLKSVQQRLSCTSVPWLPTPDPEARRLINEIVLDEESDALPDGGYASHFEMYLGAMRAAGADTGPVERLLNLLAGGMPLHEALDAAGVPDAAAEFVKRSFDVIATESTPAIVSAFAYGREDVIPGMFRQFVARLADSDTLSWGKFRFYLERHIAHDDEHHGPMCRRIIARLCGNDPEIWDIASRSARAALESRLSLWDAIAQSCESLSSQQAP
jgi:hypothetical protein